MKRLHFFILMLISLLTYGQELPPIKKFTTENYKGHNQNWMIAQGQNDFIYVANNKGLLEFNGSDWISYTSPNNTIIRAVHSVDERIYTGCYAEFGYWTRNDSATLNYTSLSASVEEELLKDNQIWNIVTYNEWLIFQSSNHLYFYNAKAETTKIISATDLIYKIFIVENRVYFHVANQGIFVVEDGKPSLLISNSVTKNERIINMFQSNEGLLLLTRNSGFYKYENNALSQWNISADPMLKKVNVFSSIQMEGGSFMLGSISDGVLHLSSDGKLRYQITQKTGLGNNTVLSLFEDKAKNVWAALDNGINCINVKSPIKTFFDNDGVIGTVYTTQLFNGYFYIGSNQGLFYRKGDAVNDSFKFVEGTAGQVWSLYNYKNETLFCGHHLGTFVIEKDKAEMISNNLGAWTFRPIPNQEDMLIQGNYSGLFILHKNNNAWSIKNKVEGFKNSSRYLEINDQQHYLISHELKGVFKLTLNDNFTSVEKIELEPSSALGKNSSLVKYKNNILFASDLGIFKYDSDQGSFTIDSSLSKTILGDEHTSAKLVVDKDGTLWAFSKENISYLENDDVANKPIIRNIPIDSKLRRGVLGFENIFSLDNQHVLGTANGYIKIDAQKINKEKEYFIHLNGVELQNIDDQIVNYPINKKASFKHKEGSLHFKFSVPEFDKYLAVNYQYQLKGQNNKWSKWSENSLITFENLSFGDYTFQVRAKVGDQLSENTITYPFRVNRPWYISNLALILYLLLFSIALWLTNRAFKKYYNEKFKQKQLESEKALMEIKNEKLNQDVDNKNRELAISTMSIIKKNRVLNKIKKELKKNKNVDNRIPLQLIDNNLNDAKDWSFFEQAFNNADKDFLEKIKKEHPNLTPNDLRFCAYLRLNLSSKEMAPLLNISVKSVETKRYRLRKKMELDHNSGLVNYILKF